jgi:hypothetical protein
MHLAHPQVPGPILLNGKYPIAEINAYIAIRDDLLVEAENVPTRANLNRVAVANNFVETCLRPRRPVYQAQYLSMIDASREGVRCDKVKQRIVALSK